MSYLLINEDELLMDTIDGLMLFDPAINKKRATELAKLNIAFIIDNMFEAQAEVIEDIALKERRRRKGGAGV